MGRQVDSGRCNEEGKHGEKRTCFLSVVAADSIGELIDFLIDGCGSIGSTHDPRCIVACTFINYNKSRKRPARMLCIEWYAVSWAFEH